VEVSLMMGAGTLALTGGADQLVAGAIQYNVAEWKPTVTSDGTDVKIEQGSPDTPAGLPDGNDVVNEWDLALGDVPMNLSLRAGAYQGTLDLSGVPLRSLEINDGASSVELKFDSVNPQEMDQLTYHTGASQVKLSGLANANFAEMMFESGAGQYTLDFSGELQRDAEVSVKSGLSSVDIIVPAGMSVEIAVGGGVTNVNTDGSWTVHGDTYSQSGSGPTLTIGVDMGLGTLRLVSQ
jgi:hypothetical protein